MIKVRKVARKLRKRIRKSLRKRAKKVPKRRKRSLGLERASTCSESALKTTRIGKRKMKVNYATLNNAGILTF